MIQTTKYARLVVIGVALMAAVACFPAQVSAQTRAQGIEKHLRKVDVNEDGRVSPEEMTGPVKRYLGSKGVDTEKGYRIRDLVAKLSKKKQSQVKAAGDLKVPEFGVEAAEKIGVPTFGEVPEKVVYPAAIIKQAKELMANYDRNGNGFLDRPEISRIRWGSPRPFTNDKNGDGRLSVEEIQERLHGREVAKQRAESARGSGQNSGQNSEQNSSQDDGGQVQVGRRGRRQNRFGRGEQGSKSGEGDSKSVRNSDTGEESKRKINTRKTSGSNLSQLDRAQQYVKQYFESRDLDKNDVLEGDELKKVVSKSKYDTNRDGKITKAEMTEVVSPSSKSSKSTATKSSSKGGRSRDSSSQSSSKTSNSFDKVDANEDGLVQMHEFAESWTKKRLDEFNAKDVNGDGVISPNEW